MFEFKITARDKKTKARVGEFYTPHGKLITPQIAFVATDGYIKGIPNEILHTLPIKFTITNTFHTYIKNLLPEIEKVGGVNNFMKSNHVTSTDSGGFQVFSLGFGKVHRVGKMTNIFPQLNVGGLIVTRDHDNLLTITEKGVIFNYDKKFLLFTPEISIDIQERLGADITFAFDECTSPLNSHEYTKQAMDRTHRWLIRSIKQYQRSNIKYQNDKSKFKNFAGVEMAGLPQTRKKAIEQSIVTQKNSVYSERINTVNKAQSEHLWEGNRDRSRKIQALFGIVQGGYFEDLRRESAKFVSKQDVVGFGIGGSLGRNKKDLNSVVEWVSTILPEDKPRHLFGIGQVRDIFEAVERGVDLFDCVIPTREARHKVLYTKHGRINIRKYKNENIILEKHCECLACREKLTYPQLIQLFRLKDPRAFLFSTAHNIQFYADLMKEIRFAIERNKFKQLKDKILKFY